MKCSRLSFGKNGRDWGARRWRVIMITRAKNVKNMCDSPRSVRLKRMLSVAAGSRKKELLSSRRNCRLPIIFPLRAEVPENCISEKRINGLGSDESGEAESLNQSNLTTGSHKVLGCS